MTTVRARPGNLQIVGVGLALFSAVLLGVGIHHMVATGTCSSTGYSANYGPVPTCPPGTGWWFAFVFGGIIGSLIGALMAGSVGLVFATIFGAVGFGAMSILLESHTQSGEKVFGAVFGGCFAVVGVIAAVAVIASAIRSVRASGQTPSSGRGPAVTSAFGTPQTSSGSRHADPILSAYSASRAAAATQPRPSPLGLVPGLQAMRQAAASDPIDELAKLADLHQKGVLTDEEFATAKSKLLGHI